MTSFRPGSAQALDIFRGSSSSHPCLALQVRYSTRLPSQPPRLFPGQNPCNVVANLFGISRAHQPRTPCLRGLSPLFLGGGSTVQVSRWPHCSSLPPAGEKPPLTKAEPPSAKHLVQLGQHQWSPPSYMQSMATGQDEDKTGSKGTLTSTKEPEKLDVFLARGCGETRVELCTGVWKGAIPRY